ncbi:MAG: hypothetical protein NG737_05290 [Omnitrophica bacterium]|nr:hypothetical protein [Candidatus Omnitrophota bacterium]
MRRYFFYFFLLVFLSAHPANLFAHYILKPDEYSVYSVLVDEWYYSPKTSRVVIRDHTALSSSLDFLEIELSYVRSVMSVLGLETIDDFKAKNIISYPVEDFFDLSVDYNIITQREIDGIFESRGGWKRFYRRYQGADGILTFSRVGFNQDRSQALVYVVTQWGDLAGTGFYILLTKQKDNTWKFHRDLRVRNFWYFEDIKL